MKGKRGEKKKGILEGKKKKEETRFGRDDSREKKLEEIEKNSETGYSPCTFVTRRRGKEERTSRKRECLEGERGESQEEKGLRNRRNPGHGRKRRKRPL